MTTEIANIVTKKMISVYEKKLAKVLTTSAQFDVYAKLISELSIFGLDAARGYAEAKVVSGEEKIARRKAYSRFLFVSNEAILSAQGK